MFAGKLASACARLSQGTRCSKALARAAASLTARDYDRLCELSYWQNIHYEGLEIEPLPRLQVNDVPIVHHPLYSAPQLKEGHRFPMQVFQTIHDLLLQDGVAVKDQVRTPAANAFTFMGAGQGTGGTHRQQSGGSQNSPAHP